MTRKNQGFRGRKVKSPEYEIRGKTTPKEQSPEPIDTIEHINRTLEEPLTPPAKRVRRLEEDWQHIPGTEWPTPLKAGAKFYIEFLENKGILYNKTDIFEFADYIPPRTGYRVLADSSARRLDTKNLLNPRHQPHVIPAEKLQEIEEILEQEGLEGRGLTWEQLGSEVGLDADRKTIQKALGALGYHKCIACRKQWVDNSTAIRRVEHSRVMLECYPHWTDWKGVRWSDECYWGWGPQGKLWIIRKPGMRRCHNCVQQASQPKEKDQKRLHIWSAVGWDFKADLAFYDAGNTNGKMSQRVYIDQILEPVVKPWLNGPKFVLEEDGDSGHGTSANNIVRTWKKDYSLTTYFNLC
jgi:hypothetical protein